MTVATRKPRSLLTVRQLRELDRVFLRAFRAIDDIRAGSAVGAFIHRTKLPSALTEGLVASATPLLFGESCIARRPEEGLADLVLCVDGGHVAGEVAVKGTGASRWVTVTETDLRAIALVWVDYTERTEDETAPIVFHVFERPLAGWAPRGRVTLRQLADALGAPPRSVRFELADVARAGAGKGYGRLAA